MDDNELREVDDSTTPRLVDTGNGRLCAQVRGSGPTVVLDSGGPGQGVGEPWSTELEARLLERFTLVTYDRAGVGRSDAPPRHTVAEMADDLHRILGELDVDLPAVLVGWSFGGLVIQVLAVRHPGDVAGLVFVDPTPTGTPPGSPLARRLSTVLAAQVYRFLAVVVRRHARTLRAAATLLANLWRQTREVAETVETTGLPAVPIRVLSAGRRPKRLPNAQHAHLAASHQALADRSPQGRRVVAEHASHEEFPKEQPELIVRAIDEVLRAGEPR